MADLPVPPPPIALEVQRSSWVTPRMVRVVLGGAGMAEYRHNDFTDRYVKLVLPPPGVDYALPLDPAVVRRDHPPEEWPRLRTYTVRGFDAEAQELWIDVVQHGDEGLAGPWAAQAQPGDLLHLRGPGGAYAPDPTADWHLLVGDETALPAIASSLEAMPPDATVVGVFEVAHADGRDYLDLPAGAQVHWLERDQPAAPTLPAAVAALDLPDGRVHAFVHGELGDVRELRRHLRDERGIPAACLSISGYWRRGKDEEGFQAEKHAEAAAEG